MYASFKLYQQNTSNYMNCINYIIATKITGRYYKIVFNFVQFQKISIITPRMVTGNFKGEVRGSKIANFFKESMKQNWNFQKGGG